MIYHRASVKLRAVACLSVLALAVLSGSAALADTATRAYATDTYLQKGTIVTLKPGDGKKVSIATAKTLSKTFGIVIAPSDAAVTLVSDNTVDQTYVATTGRFDVLVSNQNGPIDVSDYITVSALDGIGMKTDTSQPVVLGKAAGGFDGKAKTLSTAQLKDTRGRPIQVSIGRIPIELNVGRNPYLVSTVGGVPQFLSSISQTISGKPLSAVRIYTALAILVAATTIAGAMLLSGVNSSLTSIGRNPLARFTIFRGLAQVVIISLIIFIIGVLGVYLILKL